MVKHYIVSLGWSHCTIQSIIWNLENPKIDKETLNFFLKELRDNMNKRENTGFASSGSRERFIGTQKLGFEETMANVLSEILAQETEASQNVQKKIDAFRQLIV